MVRPRMGHTISSLNAKFQLVLCMRTNTVVEMVSVEHISNILLWGFLDSSVFDTTYLLNGTSIEFRSSLTGLSGVLQISVFFHWGGKFFHWDGNSNEKQKHNNLAHIRRRKRFCYLSKYISLVKPGHLIKLKNKT